MATITGIERLTTRLPEGFNPDKHASHLPKVIAKTHGEGWEVESIDMLTRIAVVTRHAAIVQVANTSNRNVKEVRLPRTAKPTDGERFEIKLCDQENANDPLGGWEMTSYDPHLGKAVLTRMTEEEVRCRGALAVSMGVKPWEVQVGSRDDGGFSVRLPKKYVGSKHDGKITEIATDVVGADGWYVNINPAKLTAEIIPSDPPSFDSIIPYPFSTPVATFQQDPSAWAKVPLGEKLGQNGSKGSTLNVDLDAAPHTQISGTSGAGKSVTLNALIAGVLARGAELAIIDVPAKSVDFMWCKQWVRDGGWGCDTILHGATALAIIYEEGQRRAEVLKEHGATKWAELADPEAFDIRPLIVIVDEVTGLFMLDDVPKLPKGNEYLVKIQESNYHRSLIKYYIAKIAAELRFVGVHIVVASQVASTITGMPTPIRLNLANKVLLGTKPTDGNRNLALNDAGSVPQVPGNIQNDRAAGRGVGVFEFEGQEPGVFKSFFASTEAFSQWLETKNLPVTSRPAPNGNEIAKLIPAL